MGGLVEEVKVVQDINVDFEFIVLQQNHLCECKGSH